MQEIPIDKIDDFPNHPFKVRMDDNMIEMAESVKQHGILVPAIVRPKENGLVPDHRYMGLSLWALSAFWWSATSHLLPVGFPLPCICIIIYVPIYFKMG